jgi:SpoVK/Ycf46/Vps4 family AAA+-type ATPase
MARPFESFSEPTARQIGAVAAKAENRRTFTKTAREAFIESINVFTPSVSFDDLILSEEAKAKLEGVISRIIHHRVLYEEWGLGAVVTRTKGVAVNLHGPPGTGKTSCAFAIAHRLNKSMIEIGYDELESKYVGDTPKNIVAAFQKAKEESAVLFFDEADSILGRRLSSVTHSADHGVNLSRGVMLRELDRFTGVVVFASNLPGNYDRAFVRRIIAHIQLDLPNEALRLQLWNRFIPPKMPTDESLDRASLASASAGFSGSEILNAVEIAASIALGRVDRPACVSNHDFLAAVDQIRAAKEVVGNPQWRVSQPHISEEGDGSRDATD